MQDIRGNQSADNVKKDGRSGGNIPLYHQSNHVPLWPIKLSMFRLEQKNIVLKNTDSNSKLVSLPFCSLGKVYWSALKLQPCHLLPFCSGAQWQPWDHRNEVVFLYCGMSNLSRYTEIRALRLISNQRLQRQPVTVYHFYINRSYWFSGKKKDDQNIERIAFQWFCSIYFVYHHITHKS